MRRSNVILILTLLLTVGQALGQNQAREAQLQQVQIQARPAINVQPDVAIAVAQIAVEGVAEEVDQPVEAPEPAPAPKPLPLPPAAEVPPGTMRFYLMDGSVLTGTLAVDSIPIQTEFGNLVVPIASIAHFKPGLQSHPDLGKRITTLIDLLGTEDAGQRDAAQAELVNYGPGLIEELRNHLDTPDAERKLRIQSALEALYEQQMDPMMAEGHQRPQPSLVRLDQIETAAFTMAGQITMQDFEIRSKFGNLSVSLSDIMAAEKLVSVEPEINRTLDVSGSDFAGISYKNTGIRLNRGDRVIIQADGQITMTPWGRNTISNPDGVPQNGMYNGNIPFGALCGRIGESGEELMIGSRTSFVAKKSGTLNLGFAMQANWANQQFPGKYNVRIRVVPGGQ